MTPFWGKKWSRDSNLVLCVHSSPAITLCIHACDHCGRGWIRCLLHLVSRCHLGEGGRLLMIANMTHQKYIVVIASAYICELVHLHWCEDSQNHCQVLLSCEKFFFCLLIHFFVYIANNMYYWKGCLKSLTNFLPQVGPSSADSPCEVA